MEFEDEHDEEQEEEEDDEDDIIIPPPAIPPSYVDSVIMNSAPHRVNPVSHQPSTEIRRSSSIPVRYRECLKNHAVGIGGHAVDGCGEFMPAGEDGTLDALKCAACNCHRNFHRKEAASASSDSATPLRGPGERNNSSSLSPGPLSSTGFNAAAFAAASAAANAAAGAGGGAAFPQHQFSAYYRTPAPHPHPHPHSHPTGYLQHRPAIPALPSSNTSGGTHSGEMGDDMSHPSSSGGGGGGGSGSGMMIMSSGGTSNNKIKKRHRTKFSQEQKDQMLGFAEKLGWRIQKHDEAAVQQFCAETQVKRQVLKVWMHNNKHTIGKKLP